MTWILHECNRLRLEVKFFIRLLHTEHVLKRIALTF